MDEIIVVLKWSYTPSDFFEKSLRIERDGYKITIENGEVDARIEIALWHQKPNFREELHEAVNNRFLGMQLFEHKPFKLSKSSMSHLHPDGRRDIFISLNVGKLTLTGQRVDIIVDKDGNITKDTKKERINSLS